MDTDRRVRSRLPRLARWSALPIALVVYAVLVWQASYAVFTGSTTAVFTASTTNPAST